MNSAEITLQAALDILGLRRGASVDEIQSAFRRAAKTAHPDAGGSEAEFARVRAALDHLRAAATRQAAPRPQRPAKPDLVLTPLQALRGGQIEATLADGGQVQIEIEPGLRAGDRLEIAGQRLRIGIATEDAIEIRGDDVWLTIPAPACGGRITAETPLGPRVLWIARGDFERGVLRYAGQGLPAHGRYRAGDLVLKLAVEGEETTLTRRRKGFLASWAA